MFVYIYIGFLMYDLFTIGFMLTVVGIKKF